jgi:two-component system KDP operon response regulator KdpE
VTKLFREGELMARVRAALRPASVIRHRREFVIGNLRIDAMQRRVFVATTEVSLTPTEFKLLHTLARHADEVVTHSQLLQEVWGFGLVSELQYLRVYIKQLRHKTEVDPTRPQRIVTSLGVGYRLVMPEATPQTQRH